MPHTGNKVADQKSPSSAAFEPGMNAGETFGRDVNIRSVFHQHVRIEDAAERITDGDPAITSAKCRSESRNET